MSCQTFQECFPDFFCVYTKCGRKHFSYHELTLKSCCAGADRMDPSTARCVASFVLLFRLYSNFYFLSRLPSIHGMSPIVHIYIAKRTRAGRHHAGAALHRCAPPSLRAPLRRASLKRRRLHGLSLPTQRPITLASWRISNGMAGRERTALIPPRAPLRYYTR